MTYATLAFVVALAGAAAAADLPAYTPDASAPCDQIPAVYHWNLAPLFASDAAWDAARTQLLADVPKLADILGQARRPAAARGVPRSLPAAQPGERAHALPEHAAGRGPDRRRGGRHGPAEPGSDGQVYRIGVVHSRRGSGSDDGPPRGRGYAARRPADYRRLHRQPAASGATACSSPRPSSVLGLLGDNLWAEIDLNEIPSHRSMRSALC